LKEIWGEKNRKTRKRRKLLLDDIKEKRGYWKLKEVALDGTTNRTGFGRGYGTVARQILSL